MSVLLMTYGLPADRALAVTAAYRLVSFWIMNPIGWAAFAALHIGERRAGRGAAPALVGQTAAARPAVLAA